MWVNSLGFRTSGQSLGFLVITLSCTCACANAFASPQRPLTIRYMPCITRWRGKIHALRQAHRCDVTCVSLLRATFPHIPQACRVHPRPRTIPPPRHDATVAQLRACAAPGRTASLTDCPANDVTKRPSARESRGQPLSAKLRPGPPALCCCPRGLSGAEVTRQGTALPVFLFAADVFRPHVVRASKTYTRLPRHG